jgi:hypothetical protein
VDGTPLLYVCRRGHTKALRMILRWSLRLPDVRLNASFTGTGMSALWAAARGGHAGIVAALLAQRVFDPNLPNDVRAAGDG